MKDLNVQQKCTVGVHEDINIAVKMVIKSSTMKQTQHMNSMIISNCFTNNVSSLYRKYHNGLRHLSYNVMNFYVSLAHRRNQINSLIRYMETLNNNALVARATSRRWRHHFVVNVKWKKEEKTTKKKQK